MGIAAISAEKPSSVASARAEMFVAFVEELNQTGIPYCLLSGHDHYPDPGDSDVDFMVGQRDAAGMIGLLQRVARRCGALLVQAMQHETGAWYFVLAKRAGVHVAYLRPDCSIDYRREGRLWLRSDELLTRRQRMGNLFVPAKPDEFLYYMIKKVLKQGLDEAQLYRLRRLYVACPEECYERMRRFWSGESIAAAVSAILSGNVWRMRWNLPALRTELLASRKVEKLPARLTQRLREWRRRAVRVIHPSGLSIAISGGKGPQQDALARSLEANLRPAFRRTSVVDDGGFGSAAWNSIARVRSTLVLRKLASSSAAKFAPDQVHFELRETPPDAELATRIALNWMADRLADHQSARGVCKSLLTPIDS